MADVRKALLNVRSIEYGEVSIDTAVLSISPEQAAALIRREVPGVTKIISMSDGSLRIEHRSNFPAVKRNTHNTLLRYVKVGDEPTAVFEEEPKELEAPDDKARRLVRELTELFPDCEIVIRPRSEPRA